ncbi:MAG: hypothetical protein Q7S73_00300 [bacterium]|nr:hypothetical protein [bacterium]
MNKSNVLTRTQQYFAVISAVVLSLLVVWAAAFGATTISSNINTGGTLTVTSTSALTGLATLTGGYISVASSSIVGPLHISGMIQASSTATSTFQNGIRLSSGCFIDASGSCIGTATSTSASNIWTGLQIFNTGGILSTASSTFSSTLNISGTSTIAGLSAGFGTFSNNLVSLGRLNVTGVATLSDMLKVSGPVNASSTLSVTGVTNHYGNVNFNSMATTTASNGNFDTSGAITSTGSIVASSTSTTLQGIGVATSTPAAEFAAVGSATTTLYLNTTKANTRPCVQLGAYRAYVVTGAGASTTGSGATFLLELGACK